MRTSTAPAPVRRPGWLRGILLIAVVLCLAAAALALLAVSDRPGLPAPATPDAAAAAEARTLAESLRDFVLSEESEDVLVFDASQVNAALSSVRRVMPGVIGRFGIEGDVARIEMSVGAPIVPGGRWVDLSLALRASEDGIDVASARIGRVPVPAWLVLPAARLALDHYLGDLGDEALDAVTSVRIDAPRVRVALAFGPGQDPATFFARLRARIHDVAGGEGARRVYVHLWHLHEAGLKAEDGLVPFLRHTVETAGRLGADDPRAELEAALFALALYCGEERLGEAAGVRPGPRYDGNSCRSTPLRTRFDLRKHFTVSAGLYAMRSDAAVLGVGELKELLDSDGGTGFSLDDMAANASGIRFARTFLDAPPSEWPGMLRYVRTEDDILPSIDGLDSGMTAEEFQARYGDIDSPAYVAVLAEIDRRIDALPLYSRERLN